MKVLDRLLHSLPDPEAHHAKHVTDLVEQIYNKHGLTELDLTCRKEVVKNIEAILKDIDPGKKCG